MPDDPAPDPTDPTADDAGDAGAADADDAESGIEPSGGPDDGGLEPGARQGWLPERGADRYLGGVASGIARALDVDPLVVRVAVVAAALYVPAAVVLYALAWLVMPDGYTHRSLLSGALGGRDVAPALGVAALGLGAAVLAPELGPGGDGGLTFGVVLLGLGFLLITGRVGSRPGPPPDEPPPGPPGPPVATGSTRAPRPKAYLGWFGISALVLLGGGLAAVDQGWEPVEPGVAVSACLLLVGVVLCVAAWRGRARVLLPAGVALLPLWVGLSASGIPRFEGDGDVHRVVQADEPVPAAFRHGYGNLDVDLTPVDFPDGERRTIAIGLTAGRVLVRLPPEVHVEIRGDVGIGVVELYDPWQVDTDGPYVLHEVDRTFGDPRDLCQPVEEYPPISSLVEQPGETSTTLTTTPTTPITPTTTTTTTPSTSTTSTTTPSTTIVYRDERTWEPCTPEPPPENPAVVELVLDVGMGSVEVHRG